jgi:phosphoribosyl-AMP cyclohydrolase
MVGFMNDEALAATERTGYATFFQPLARSCG